jgi:hypothetical protein
MKDEFVLPDLEPYVLSLIVVAAEGARTATGQPAMIENAALRVGLQWIGDLPKASSERGQARDLVKLWIGHLPPPNSAFQIAACLSDAIDQLVRNRHPSLQLPFEGMPTKFDQHVFLAIGQTICRVVGFRVGTGPSAHVAWAQLSRQSPRNLQQRFLRNYLGNVLQDFFDACHVRAEFVRLPKGEEEALRTQDAEDLAETVFGLMKTSNSAASPEEVITCLRRVIARVWIVEDELDDDQGRRLKSK